MNKLRLYHLYKIFLNEYYIPAVLYYSKPIKRNKIEHEDISVLIDPYIQSYRDFFSRIKARELNSYVNLHVKYFIPKLCKEFDKNKKLRQVFVDVKSYFTSKIRKECDFIENCHLNYTKTHEIINSKNNNKQDIIQGLFNFLMNINYDPQKAKTEIEHLMNKIQSPKEAIEFIDKKLEEIVEKHQKIIDNYINFPVKKVFQEEIINIVTNIEYLS